MKKRIIFCILICLIILGFILGMLYYKESERMAITCAPIDDLTEMQFNNQKFTIYEGIITGSKIKQLIKTVNASNIANDGTEQVVSINGRINENRYEWTGIHVSKKYKVEVEYDNDLVSNINIYQTVQTENNTINTNYSEFAQITGYKEEGTVGKVYKHVEENIINEVKE